MHFSRFVSSRDSYPVSRKLTHFFAALFLMVATLATLPAIAQEPVPTPPRVYLNTTWNPPTGGATYNVNSVSSFQLALTFAQPGDTIILSNSTVYSGNITLPAKPNPNHQWIYIESSALASLPPPGTRVGPGDDTNMAKIVTPNGLPPLTIAAGASGYRLVGLEITTASIQGCNPHNNPPVNCFTYHLLDAPTAIGSPLIDSITVDRCYIHGSPSQDARVGVVANGTNYAVIDSYISDIHQSTADSQGILAYWTPGPIKIVNNYVSATTEDVMLGGAGGYNNPYVPSDIEIRNNHFYKPLSWDQPGITIPPYAMWVEKNNLEFKSAQRVVVTGNTLENTWVSGQRGYSAVLTVRTSQSGNIGVVDDILFENNILKNVDAGFNTLEQDNDCGAQYGYPQCTNPGESKRVKIDNNLILLSNNTDTTQHTWLDVDGGNSVDVGLTDWVVQHNTALMIDYSEMWNFVFNLPQMPWDCNPPQGFSATHNIWMLDNAITRQPIGTCSFTGSTGLGWYMGDPSPLNPRFYGNVMWVPSNERIATWPPANDATGVPFVYENPSNGDFRLQSPYWTNTTDGLVAGIGWAALENPSTTTLTASLGTLYQTQSTTLTATVSIIGSGGPPTGTVNFMMGTTVLGTGTLAAIDGADASASIQVLGSQLSLGANNITAVYSGDSNYEGSASAPISVTVLQSQTMFGNENVGTTSPVQTLTYNFTGNVQLSAINILTMGTPGLDFQDGGSSTCTVGTHYTSGQNCSVTVTFSPLAPGLRAGAVMLFAQGSSQPLVTWYLSGVGESPAVTIDPGTQTTLASITNAATYGSAMDGAGNLYVADQANGQVVKVAAGTQQQSVVVSQLSAPTSVALDGAGNLYIAQSSGVAMIPNNNGTLYTSGMENLSIAGLGLAQGIAEDGNGNLYIADSGTGDVIQVPGGSGTPVTIASGLTNPHDVAVDAGGNVYVASDNQVSEYPAGGGTAIPLGSGYAAPQALTVDPSGTVYVADTGNARIVEVSPGGESQTVLSIAGLAAPHGVTLDSTGDLYISDSSNVYEMNRVQAAALNFGTISVGNTSPAQTLAVSNIGNQQLNVSAVTISENFLQQASGGYDCNSSTQLGAGGQCLIAVVFSPTTTGPLNGSATLTDNALNNSSSQQSVGLSGTGTSQQQQQQTITFPNPGTQTYGVVPITLTATASSGLPVSYTVVSGPATVNGSTLTITGAGSVTVQANQAGNGQWAPAPPVNDTFTVNPAVLTVTANNASMTYGGTLPTFTASYTGFVNGDGQGVLSGSPSLTTTAGSGSPIGNYTITASQGTLSSQNYTFTFVNGTLTINPAVLTVTANNATMTYGGTLPTLTASYTGFVNGDGQGVLSGAPNLTTTATSGSPVGNYAITVTQGTLSAQNYTFTFVNGTLTINKAVLTVTANNASMTYGGTLPSFTASYSGFVNGDGQGVLSGAPSLTTTATSGSPVGSYPINASQGTLTAQNYTFTFVNGALTINPAVLTVTANSFTITAGSPLPTFTVTYTGFLNGDNQGVLGGAPSVTTTAPQDPPVGTYPIIVTQGTLSAQNYTFTFVNGTLTVVAGSNAQITSPPKNSQLTGSTVTFTWTPETGGFGYQVWVGHAPGTHDIALVATLGLSVKVLGLPTDGSQIYVTLYGFANGSWTVQDTATYTASSGQNAQITSPPKNSQLTGSSVTFDWTAETGAIAYQLWVGHEPGAHDIALQITFGLSARVNNLPTDGSQVYVTLYGYTNGAWTVQDTATYTAAQ